MTAFQNIVSVLHRHDITKQQFQKQSADLKRFDLNRPNDQGLTPLMYEVFFGTAASVAHLLLLGVDTEAEVTNGETIIFSAVEDNLVDKVWELCVFCNLNHKCSAGYSPVALARHLNYDLIAGLLELYGGKAIGDPGSYFSPHKW